MAKKSVASLQKGSKRLSKVIKMEKKEGSNNYSFVETIIDPSYVKQWLSGEEIIINVEEAKKNQVHKQIKPEAPAEAPAKTSAEAPAETSAETSAEAPAETSAEESKGSNPKK